MSKEKKRSNDVVEQKETLFYYETIGIICIILVMVLLLRLGSIGYWLYILFKVIFGDYYFVFVFFWLFYGFYCLFKHQGFDLKNQRFIGFILLSIGVMMFSHISVHNFVVSNDGSYFTNTWNVYWNYLSLGYGEVLGGGIIGAILFFIFYYLFGIIGVSLVSALIIMLGTSLLINRSLIEIFSFFIIKIKNIGKYTKNFNNFFKYEIGRKDKKFEKENIIYNKRIQVPLKILEEYHNEINYNFQERLAQETKSLIHSVFSSMHLEYKDIDLIVSYKVTTYRYFIFSVFNSEELLLRLKNIIEEDILFGQDSNKVVFQINNKHNQIFNVRNMLMKQTNLLNNYILPLGIAYDNKIIDLDLAKTGGLMIVGRNDSGITNFIESIIISLFVKNNLMYYSIELFDDYEELSELSEFVVKPKLTDVVQYLDIIKQEIDERLYTFDNNNVNYIDEYNKKMEIQDEVENIIPRKFIILNPYIIDDTLLFEDKLMYCTQAGVKVGIFFFHIIRDINRIFSILNSLYESKIVFKCDQVLSKKVLMNLNATALVGNGDCIYLYKGKQTRVQTAYVSKKDLESVIKYIK